MYVYIVAGSRVMSFSDPDLGLTPTGLIDQWFLEQTPGSWLRILPWEAGQALIIPPQSFQGIPREQGRPGAQRVCLLLQASLLSPRKLWGFLVWVKASIIPESVGHLTSSPTQAFSLTVSGTAAGAEA